MRIWTVILGVALLANAAWAGNISLRQSASMDTPRAVVLRDVAELSGPDASALGDTVVVPVDELSRLVRSRGWVEVDMERIRRALKDAGAPMGRLAVAGSACIVRVAEETTEAPTTAPAEPVKERAEPEEVSLEGIPTVRIRVVQSLLTELGIVPADMRVRFDARDTELLDQPEGARRVIARPVSTAGASPGMGQTEKAAAKMLVEVRIVEGDQQVLIKTIGAVVSVRHQVLRLVHDVPRHQPIVAGDVELTDQWMPPGAAGAMGTDAGTALSVESLTGRIARTRLAQGSTLSAEMLTSPNVVKRGDVMEVWVYRGGLALKARATAQKDGAVGESIPCKLDRSTAPFMVRIDAAGRGTLVNSDVIPAKPEPAATNRTASAARAVRK